jgi:competence ComEA-like helix-hairpin-helix protein
VTLYGSNVVLVLIILGNFFFLFTDSLPMTGETNVSPYRVHLQTATAAELELLPGIGPAMADRIVVYRFDHELRTPDDLIEIHGIGQKTVDGMRHLVTEERNDQ